MNKITKCLEKYITFITPLKFHLDFFVRIRHSLGRFFMSVRLGHCTVDKATYALCGKPRGFSDTLKKDDALNRAVNRMVRIA